MSRLGQIQRWHGIRRQPKASAGHGIWILVMFVLALIPGALGAQTYQGAPVDLGYRDFEFTGGTSEITEEKPESKLWYHDGLWWAVMWEPNSATFRIHKFSRNDHSWTNVGPEVDDRARTGADVLVDGNTLYVSSRAKLNIQASKSEVATINRYTYSGGSQSYSLDSGFPVQISGSHKTRALTLAKDSNNKLWAAWENDTSVVINRTDGLDDTNWGTAFLLPSQGSNTQDIDISALTAFKGDRIGVLWSNQNDEVMYFAVHPDDSVDTNWQAREIVLNGQPNMADDHINLAVRESDGTVLVVTKTGLGGSTNPGLVISRRDGATGVWTNHVAWETSNDMTRPVIVYNSDSDSAYVMGKSDAVSPKTIFVKAFDVDNPAFDATSLGRIFMRSQIDDEANNITSTKQTVTNASGILLLASDRNTKRYLHRLYDFNNNRPTAGDDSYTVNQGAATVLNVTVNDTDSDGTIDVTTTAVVVAPDSGAVSINPASGELTYTPISSFKGTETFSYTVSDNDGANALAAIVTISINGVPVAGDDNVATDEDTPVDFSPLTNDSDPDGLVVSSLTVIGTPANGSFNYNSASGVMTYTPNAGFHGSDVMTYAVDDASGATSNTATISLIINDVNDLPIAQDDAVATDNETPTVIDILSNDSDSDGTLQPATVALTQQPSGGTISINTTTGALTYTANSGFFGEDSVRYTVQDDDAGVTNAAKVALTVSAVPVAAKDSVVTDADVAIVIDVLANDSDADGTLVPSSVTVATAPANGTTSVNPITGAITYTPNSGFLGQETFFYTVDDNSGLTSSQGTIVVRIFGPPIANDDNAATELNTLVAIDILANDEDLDGGTLDPASVNVFLGPFNGSMSISASTGVVSYTPNNNFAGTDILRYTVDDNDGSTSNDAVVTIKVTVAPTAVDDNANTTEDSAVQISVTANDSDTDGTIDPATVEFPSGPANGAVAADVSGIVTYTPAADYFGSDTFTYTVKDNDGLASNAATVNVTISPVNDAPVAQNDTSATGEETPVDISVASNDTDIDGSVEATSVTLISQPSNGSATVNGSTGVVTYVPITDFFGQDSFTYTIDDNAGATSNIGSVVVNVSDVNDPPQANADTGTTPEETTVSVDVTANDSDIDGTVDVTTVSVTTPPQHGSATANGATGEIDYTPSIDFFGTDSLQYSVQDDRGGVSNPASVVFTVTDVNDPPLAINDTANTAEEIPVEITVAANDSDQDGIVVPTTVTVSSQPGNGSATVNPATGVVTYTPATDFSGADTFSYTIDDEDGATSAAGNVVVNVTDVNDPPVAVDDNANTQEDLAVDINLASNDTDIDGSPVPTSILITGQPSNGGVSVNPGTGIVTYTPALDFVGSDSFQYTIDDDDGATSGVATVAVSVTSVNDAPVAADDAATTLEENSVDIDVIANDSDVDGTVDATTVIVESGPQNGGVSVNAATGVITYSPSADFSGEDSLRYSVKDNDGLVSNNGKVTLTVTDVNDAPVANDDATTTDEDTPVVINVVGNDTDIDGSLVFSTLIASPGANGATSINPATGEITYTPSSGFSGADTFIYRINDDDGATSNDATVTVTVNNAPIALDDSVDTNENTAVTVDVAANDSDANGVLDLASVAIAGPAGNGTTSINPTTGAITYTPATDFSGTEVFTYTIDDNAGASSTPATVKVFVNDTPVAVDDNATTNENTVVQIDVTANDADSDGSLDLTSVTIASGVSNGSTSINPASGVVSYTPGSNFSGQDSFTYSLKDDKGVTSNIASVTISVNDAPVASDDVASTDETAPVVVSVLSNDTDSDGSLNPTTVTVTGGPANGSTSVNSATGAITYTANAAFFGVDTFTYTVQDDGGATANAATVSITVVDINDTPLAQNDAAITLEDSPIAINVVGNDSDPDGSIDPTTVAITQTINGSAVPNPGNGLVTYTPAPDFFGADTFRYTVNDLAGGTSNEALVAVNVLGVNDPPLAVNDTVSTPEDTPIVIPVTANDTDVDGAMTVLTIIDNVGHGSAVVNSGAGQVTYTPNANFGGADSFTYTVRDNNGGTSNTATVFITVISQNDLPVAVDDNVSTPEDNSIAIDLLANDTDVDGTISPASVGILVGPAHGGYSLNSSTGVLTYTSDANFFGEDSLTYVVQDNEGALSNQGRVRITVSDVNDLPVAADDNAATPEDTPVVIVVVANDNDLDGTLDTITITGGPANGSTSVNNGTGAVTYTPNQNFAGSDQFTYTVQDDDGGSSNTATVTINIASENDAPIAADDNVTTPEDTPLVIAVLANDTDPDGTLIPGSVIVTSNADHGTTSVNPTTGDITYTPESNFFGDDSLTYVVQDDIGAISNTGTVRIAVTSVNDLPVAVDDNVATAEDTPVTIPVAANDSDSDGTLVTLTITSGPSNGSTSVSSGTGEITYTPDSNFFGADQFTYTVTDNDDGISNVATVVVNVSSDNDLPLAVNDTVNVDEDNSIEIFVLANDSDPDGTLIASSVLIVKLAKFGSASVNPSTGTITYVPQSDFFGADSFQYVVQDNFGGLSNVADVLIDVNSVNDLPVAVNDAAATSEDSPVTVAVTANDTDADGTISTINIVVAPDNGSVVVNNGAGELTYTPDSNFNGPDSLTYTVTDNDGGTSNVADVLISVGSENDVPVALDDAATTDEDIAVVVDVLANDSDLDGTVVASSVTVVGAPQNGSFTINSSTGAITYTPNLNYFGDDSLTYQAQDNLGALSNIAKVFFTVNDINDLPVAVDDNSATPEDTQVTISVTANDTDVDGTITTITIIDDVDHGATFVNNGAGQVIYAPSLDFFGPDSFSYSLTDNDGGVSDTATVTVTVNSQNDLPIAVKDSVGTSKNTPVDIAVLANDSDVDGTLQPASVSIVTPATNGSTSVNPTTGAVTYTPAAFYFGPDSFEYTVQDDAGGTTNVSLVKISVVGANEIPVAVNDTVATDEDTPLVIAVTTNDTEIDGTFNFATLTVGSAPGNGTTSVNTANGEITYSPDPEYFGGDSFTYTVEDDAGAVTNAATVLITVNSVNDLPVANDDSATTPEEQQVVVNVVTNDTDSDGSVTNNTLTIVSTPIGGTASANLTNGEITYAPNQDFDGADSLKYTIDDNEGGTSNLATVRFTVTGINDAPVAADDSAATTLDTPVSLAILANDTDVDGTIDTTTLSVTLASHGTTALNSSGVLTYTPDSGFGGLESFTYSFRDDQGLQSNIATVRVRVGTLPMAKNDTLSTDEEVAVAGNVLANDIDPDGTLDATSVVIASQPGNGTASANPATGEVTYTPDHDFFGTDTFTYTVGDDEGNTSLPGTVVVNVAGINDLPAAVRDSVVTPEDTPIAISVLDNDTDSDGTIVPGSATIITGPGHGAVQFASGTGVLTYTPASNFFGIDSLTYAVDDNSGATSVPGTVVITVTTANDPPVAANDGLGTNEDAAATFDVLANDSDADGTLDVTSVSITQAPVNGAALVNGTTGEIQYIPTADFSGQDSIKYSVADNQGAASNVATVTIAVAQVNDAPVAVNDTASTSKNSSLDISVTSNDTDIDGTIDTSSLSVTAASNGTTSLKPGGVVAYTPNQNFIGADSFTYSVRDDQGVLSNPATVLIVVTSAPLVADDHKTISEGQVATIDVLANDSDPDGSVDPTSVVFETPAAVGTAAINPTTGVVTYTPPDLDFTSNDQFIFSYRVRDNEGNLSDSARVFLTVTDVNDPPVAQDDVEFTPEDTPVQLNVLANDTDIDGVVDPATVTLTASPLNGSATVNPTTGVITYTPNANFFGIDALSYTADDEDGATSNTAEVVINVATQNDTPVAVADQAATNEDVSVAVDVVANDTDPDGSIDATQVSITGNPSNGSAVVNPATGEVTYTPAADFAGEDSVKYTVKDNLGATSNEAKITITVAPVNDAPVAADDIAATGEDTPVSVNVLVNDSDIDGPLAPATVAIVVSPVNGTASVNPTTGEITYTPNQNFAGADALSYTVQDDIGLVSNQAELTLNVTDQNDFPVATADTALTDEDVAVAINVISNDVDLDGTINPASVAIVSAPGNGSSAVNPATGVVTYTPGADFFGEDSLKYTVKDNLGASTNLTKVLITVNAINDAPEVANDAATTGVNVDADVDVLANDTDVDGTIDPSTVALTTVPLNGTASVAANGLVTYTPNAGFEGQDTFSYTVQDELLATSAPATVTVDVTAGGLATKTFDSIHDGQVKVTELAKNYGAKGTTKVEDGKFITYLKFNVSGVSGPVQSASVQLRVTDGASDGGPDGGSIFQVSNDFAGTATPWVEATLTSGNAPAVSGSPLSSAGTVASGQNVEFDLSGVVSGNGSFSFAVKTASGNQVKYSTKEGVVAPKLVLKIGSPPQNTSPVAANDAAATPADTPVVIDVLSNDSDSDGTIEPSTVTVGAAPINGTATVNTTTGAITYSPNAAFQGNDLFTYSVSDDDGATSNTATVDVTVTSGLVAPVAGNDVAATTGTTPIGIDVTVNDSDSDGSIIVTTVAIDTAPLNGTATVNTSTGIVTYTANPAFQGTDQFTYTVQDDDALTSNIATVDVTVAAGNISPVAQADNATTPEDVPVAVDVLVNDSDSDGAIDIASVSVSTSPLNGAVVVNSGTGAITYTPNSGFTGLDSFAYTVSDNLGAVSNPATVNISVTSSSGGQTLTFTSVGDGQVKQTDPVANYGTKETMKVDGGKFSSYLKFDVTGVSGAVQSARVQLQVTSEANDGGNSGGSIFLVDNTFSGTAIPWVEGTLTFGNAPTAAGSPLQTLGAVSPNQLVEFDVTTAVSGNGAFSFAITPASTNEVKYYTREGSVAPKLVVVTGGGGGGNQPPVAADDNATTLQDNAIAVDVTANDSDSDGAIDISTVTIIAQPGNGSAGVNATNGLVTYTPNSGFTGSDTFTYTVDDDQAATSNQASVTITVNGTGGGQTLTFASVADGQVKLTEPGSNYGSKSTMKVDGGKFSSYMKFEVTGVSGSVTSAKVRLLVTPDPGDGGDSGGSIFLVANTFVGTTTPWDEAILTSGNAPTTGGSPIRTLGAVTPSELVEFDVTGSVFGNGTFSFAVTPTSGNEVKYYTKEGARAPELVISTGSGGGGSDPVALNDNVAGAQDVPVAIDVTVNDNDADGTIDVTTVQISTPPANGAATVSSTTGVVTYSPNSGFSGTDTFGYTVNDNDGRTSNVATVTVTVIGSNQPPVAANDNSSANAGVAVAVDVTVNDSDSDGNLDVTTVTLVSNPANGTASVNSSNGLITYTSDSGFDGADTFTYTVDDNDGATSNIATVTVQVTGGSSGQTLTFGPTDDAQIKLTSDSNYGSKATMKVEALKFSSYLKFDVSGLSGAVQSAKIRLRITDDPADGGPAGGSIFLASNNFDDSTTPWVEETLTLSNAPAAIGSALSTIGAVTTNQLIEFDVTGAISGNGIFSFLVRGDSGNQVKYFTKEGLSTKPELVVVAGGSGGGGNSAPVAANDNAAAASGTPISIDVTLNDSDSDGTIDVTTVVVVTPPANGSTSVNSSTGVVTYTSNSGFGGSDTFTYTVRDNDGATSNFATVTVNVASGNQPPVAVSDISTSIAGIPIAIDVTLNDTDSDGTLNVGTVAIATQPANGSASVSNLTGVVTYSPNSGFSGTDSFTYTVQDNDGAVSNVATVTVTVLGGGGGGAFSFAAIEDGQVKISDPGANYGAKGTMKVERGKFDSYIKFDVSGVTGSVQDAIVRLHVTVDPGDGSDSGGSVYLTSNNFTGTATAWQEETLTSGNAPDLLSGALSTLGEVAENDVVDFDVTGAVSGNGTLSFCVRSGNGDQVKYYTKDGLTAPQLIITTSSAGAEFAGEDRAPSAIADEVSTQPGASIAIDVLANDRAGDRELLRSTVAAVTMPAHGQVRFDAEAGRLVYTPADNFTGMDSFDYIVQDGNGKSSNPARVVVKVGKLSTQAPVTRDDAAFSYQGVPVVIEILANDDRADESAAEIVSPPEHGTVTLDVENGRVVYAADGAFFGQDVFTYVLANPDGVTSSEAEVVVDVRQSEPQILALLPTDDAFVRSTAPTDNFGNWDELRATNGSAEFYSFLKFDVRGLTGAVRSATLKLFVSDHSERGRIVAVSNTYRDSREAWREDGLVWDNAPELNNRPQAEFEVAGRSRRYLEIDVTGMVSGEGMFSFAVSSEHSSDAAIFVSKEGEHPPQLVVETGVPTTDVALETSGDQETDAAIPTTISLSPNFPNPFNAETTILYGLPADSKVKLEIYNIRGQLVRTLVDGVKTAGRKRLKWFGRDNGGIDVSSGVYFMRLEVGQTKFARRILLQK